MIGLLSRFLRFLVVLLVVRIFFRAVAGWIRARDGAAAAAPSPTTLVRDRVCNTYLPRDHAHRARIAGRDEYFCSPACRDRALADPSRMLASRGT